MSSRGNLCLAAHGRYGWALLAGEEKPPADKEIGTSTERWGPGDRPGNHTWVAGGAPAGARGSQLTNDAAFLGDTQQPLASRTPN